VLPDRADVRLELVGGGARRRVPAGPEDLLELAPVLVVLQLLQDRLLLRPEQEVVELREAFRVDGGTLRGRGRRERERQDDEGDEPADGSALDRARALLWRLTRPA